MTNSMESITLCMWNHGRLDTVGFPQKNLPVMHIVSTNSCHPELGLGHKLGNDFYFTAPPDDLGGH